MGIFSSKTGVFLVGWRENHLTFPKWYYITRDFCAINELHEQNTNTQQKSENKLLLTV